MEWNAGLRGRNPVIGPGSFFPEKFPHRCGLYLLHSLFSLKLECSMSISTLQKSLCWAVVGFLPHASIVKTVTCVGTPPKQLTTGPSFSAFISLSPRKCEEGPPSPFSAFDPRCLWWAYWRAHWCVTRDVMLRLTKPGPIVFSNLFLTFELEQISGPK